MASEEFNPEIEKVDEVDYTLIPGAAEAGDALEEWADKILGKKSDAKAVFFMGVCSLSFSFVTMVLYWSLNRFYGVRALKIAFWVSQIAYLPQGIIWISSAFWDILMLRRVFKLSTSISLLAPFAGNWIAVIFFMIYVDANSMWADWETWLGLILWVGWTVFIMIIQVTLSPKIFRWASAPPGTDPDTDPPVADVEDEVVDDDVDSFLATF